MRLARPSPLRMVQAVTVNVALRDALATGPTATEAATVALAGPKTTTIHVGHDALVHVDHVLRPALAVTAVALQPTTLLCGTLVGAMALLTYILGLLTSPRAFSSASLRTNEVVPTVASITVVVTVGRTSFTSSAFPLVPPVPLAATPRFGEALRTRVGLTTISVTNPATISTTVGATARPVAVRTPRVAIFPLQP